MSIVVSYLDTYFPLFVIGIAILIFITIISAVWLKKRLSGRRYALVLSAILLVVIAVGSAAYIGMKNNYVSAPIQFVKDYGKEINSMEEAKAIFKEIAYENNLDFENQTQEDMWIESAISRTVQEGNFYRIRLTPSCYILYTNGKLYRSWCGD